MDTSGPAPSPANLVVVVTGANGSIGSATASVFAQEARGIVLFGHQADDPEKLKSLGRSDRLLAITGDITSAQDVRRLVETTITRFGKIDVLINCAGSVPRQHFLDMPHAEWQAAVEANLLGYALVCRAVLPSMIKNGFGRIVNIATRLAASPEPLTSAYSSSKAAAHILMRSLAAELTQQGHRNVLINELIPGPTRNKRNPNGQDPLVVVPFVRQLVLLPPGGPTGKTYFRGEIYDLFGQH
jgi:NAD(P)-dependent dehydrogenase (short-subunit alcohol dehydrogenase family)